MDAMILTVSSKGQISLPAKLRKLMSIDKGDKLVAYTSGDVIMLKPLELPTVEDFEKSMSEARDWAASLGYQEQDVDDIIKSVMARKNK